MVFLKDFSKKLILKKNPQMTKKHAKLPSMQRVNMSWTYDSSYVMFYHYKVGSAEPGYAQP